MDRRAKLVGADVDAGFHACRHDAPLRLEQGGCRKRLFQMCKTMDLAAQIGAAIFAPTHKPLHPLEQTDEQTGAAAHNRL
jgi:hypothetical protein